MKNLTLKELNQVAGGKIMDICNFDYASHLVYRMEQGAFLGYVAFLVKPNVALKSSIFIGAVIGLIFGHIDHAASIIDTSTFDIKACPLAPLAK